MYSARNTLIIDLLQTKFPELDFIITDIPGSKNFSVKGFFKDNLEPADMGDTGSTDVQAIDCIVFNVQPEFKYINCATWERYSQLPGIEQADPRMHDMYRTYRVAIRRQLRLLLFEE
jgi:hypothetical protein